MNTDMEFTLLIGGAMIAIIAFLKIMFTSRMPTWWQEAFFARKAIPTAMLVVIAVVMHVSDAASPIARMTEWLALAWIAYFVAQTATFGWRHLLAAHGPTDAWPLLFWWPVALLVGGIWLVMSVVPASVIAASITTVLVNIPRRPRNRTASERAPRKRPDTNLYDEFIWTHGAGYKTYYSGYVYLDDD